MSVVPACTLNDFGSVRSRRPPSSESAETYTRNRLPPTVDGSCSMRSTTMRYVDFSASSSARAGNATASSARSASDLIRPVTLSLLGQTETVQHGDERQQIHLGGDGPIRPVVDYQRMAALSDRVGDDADVIRS